MERRTESAWVIEVFFDGDCPLCRREITMLQRLDRRGHIRFTDLVGIDEAALAGGPDRAERMRRIHARTRDGRWVTGVEVLRRLYEAVGLGLLVGWTRARPVDAGLEAAYEWFARNRLRLTGRCEEGTCAVVTDVA